MTDTAVVQLEAAVPQWRDRKRYLWPLGLAIPLMPFAAWGLVSATGLGVFWWWGPLFLYGLLPVLDTIIGTDAANPAEAWIARPGGGPVLPVVHLPVPAAAVRRAWCGRHGR